MRSHAHQCTDGDDASAADAIDEDVEWCVARRNRWLRQQAKIIGRIFLDDAGFGLLELAAADGDEARAEAFDARIILVPRGLIDGALAAELGLQRQNRRAVRLHAAVAATFADGLVDEQALIRVGIFAFFAAAAFLGGAG